MQNKTATELLTEVLDEFKLADPDFTDFVLEAQTTATDAVLYFNTGHREAICVSVEHLFGQGATYQVRGEAWDASGGLDSEHWFGDASREMAVPLICAVLAQCAESDAELERIFAPREDA